MKKQLYQAVASIRHPEWQNDQQAIDVINAHFAIFDLLPNPATHPDREVRPHIERINSMVLIEFAFTITAGISDVGMSYHFHIGAMSSVRFSPDKLNSISQAYSNVGWETVSINHLEEGSQAFGTLVLHVILAGHKDQEQFWKELKNIEQ